MFTSRHKTIMKAFGSRLKQARIKADYPSAQQFAAVLGLEPHTYRKYERGESEPNLETLTRLCELLDITPNYLLPIAAGEKKATPAPSGSAAA